MMHSDLPVIAVDHLLDIVSGGNIVLIDASAGPEAREKYAGMHLKGALFVDLEKQLADIKEDAADGGRHPLPHPDQFREVLNSLGISRNSHVIIYDDKNAANAAARFWWMLKSAGHVKAQVIDGGLTAAIEGGFPISGDVVKPLQNEPYPSFQWKLPIADINEVKEVAKDESHTVIDVRDAYRYLGEKEPIDLIAGHIPGAINIPFTGNLNENGTFLSPNALKEKYKSALGNKPASNIIVHCGSGVTACHTILAMAYAGMEIPKLYVGSWSEWSRCNLPIATKDRF